MKSELILSNYLSSIDYAVFAIIILITLLFVYIGQKKKRHNLSKEDNFLDLMLMGRTLTLPMFVATLVATWYGGIFGVSQIAFKHGIFNFITQGVFWYLTYLIFALFILPKIHKYNAMTLPDLIGEMFGQRSKKLSAVFNILNLIPIVYTISLGLLLQMIFGISISSGIFIGVSFVLLYSFVGGLRSVVYSDIFQFFIMVSSVILVFLLSYIEYGIDPLKTLPAHYFDPLSTFSFSEVLVWGLIALSTLVDPNFYQRCFAAKDFKVAKKGIILSTLVWMVFDISLTFGAIYARAIIPEANPENGYFIYSLQLLPPGLRGFFLAGVAATILSTLDSYIFLAGSTLSYDLVSSKIKNRITVHHLGVFSVALFSCLLALSFEGDIKNVWKTLGSISSSALLLPVILGYIFPNKISDNAFVLASLSGAVATIYWRLSGLKYTYNLDEIYIGMSASLLGFILGVLFKKVYSKSEASQ